MIWGAKFGIGRDKFAKNAQLDGDSTDKGNAYHWTTTVNNLALIKTVSSVTKDSNLKIILAW